MSFNNGGFIEDEAPQKPVDEFNEPAAMESEYYVDGKIKVGKPKSGKKKSKKSKKKEDTNYFSYFCGLVRNLWATRQTEDIDKIKNPDKYVKVTLRELFIYLIFLTLLTIISLGMISSETYNFANVMMSAFPNAPDPLNNDLMFSTVVSMNQIWQNLQAVIVPALYTTWYNTKNYDANNTRVNQEIGKYVEFENRVLGLARLRQLRVMGNSCAIPDDFKQEIKYCFADWSANFDDTTPFGLYGNQNITNDSAWYYQTEKQLGGSSHQGYMNNYGGGGFVVNLATDAATSGTIVQKLFDNLWIDRGTRAVFFDFTVYNANLNLFCQVRLLYELPATGGVVPQSTIRAVKLLRYVSSFDYFILVCEIFFAIFIVYYTIEEIIEIKKHKWSYFTTIWNILDILILMMSTVGLVFNLYRQIKVDNLLEGLLKDENKFIDFEFLCYWSVQYNNAMAFIVFLAWVKIFKYVSFNKTMTQLSLTLSRCAKDVSGFAVMFFIVFLAYAQLGFLCFGTQVYDFSTFAQSIYTLFRIILGDFDFDSLEQANRVLGPIYFLSYVFFVFFVLLNMFIAIISDTYGEIKEELADKKSDIELASFFKKGYNRVLDKLNLKRAQIIDIQKAVTMADINNDKKVDFVEFRNSLRTKGYGDVEIETLFAKYDKNGTRCLDEEEQRNMLKDLCEQNEELKDAYKALEKANPDEEKSAEKGEGVPYEDYTNLADRIVKMETSMTTIIGKVDSVLSKLDSIEKTRTRNVTSASSDKFNQDGKRQESARTVKSADANRNQNQFKGIDNDKHQSFA